MQALVEQLIIGLSIGATYALIALGYTMVYGVLRLINFAHGDVFMVGAMIGVYAATWFGLVPKSGAEPHPTWAGFMLVLAFSLWTVIPLAWIWVGSHVSSSQAPSAGPYMLVFFGIVSSIVCPTANCSK